MIVIINPPIIILGDKVIDNKIKIEKNKNSFTKANILHLNPQLFFLRKFITLLKIERFFYKTNILI